MPTLCTKALEELEEEFASRLKTERDAGMIDLKMFCDISQDTSSQAIVWTLNNALKQYQEGGVGKMDLDALDAMI